MTITINDICITKTGSNIQEFDEAVRFIRNGGRRDVGHTTLSHWESILCPVRTRGTGALKDLFLPQTFRNIECNYNPKDKIDDVATKRFCAIPFLLLDIVSCPVRVITWIPRAIFNVIFHESSLPKLFRDHGLHKLSDEFVIARLQIESKETIVESENSIQVQFQNAENALYRVNLVERPWLVNNGSGLQSILQIQNITGKPLQPNTSPV